VELRLGCSDSRGVDRLEIHDVSQAAIDLMQQRQRCVAGLFGQIRLVESDHRGDVHDRVFREPCHSGGQEHVAGHRGQVGVGGDHHGQHGRQPAAVVRVCRDDQYRPALGWARSCGRSQICPVDTTPLDHQSPEASARTRRPTATASAAESSCSPRAATARSIWRVTDPASSSSRYRAAAREKNSDRLIPRSCARRDASLRLGSTSVNIDLCRSSRCQKCRTSRVAHHWCASR